MNLNELQDNNKVKLANRVLRETYDVNLNLENLSLSSAQKMLTKVRKLISETRTGRQIHNSHQNSNYLKLLMMEQALSGYVSQYRESEPIIVVENEQVQKSQVILAAQEMIDTVQKMLEQVSKMNVEELAAVVDGIQNEIGVTEAEEFKNAVGSALQSLQDGLSQTKDQMTNSLGVLTGEVSPPAMMPGQEAPEEPAAEELPELPELPEEPSEEEPEISPGNLGRGRR